MSDRHGVVHPIDDNGLLGTLIAVRVDHRVALLAPFGDTDVIHLGLLAAELIKKAFDHLRGLLHALTRVRDTGLLYPFLQIDHVFVDMVIDVAENLFQVLRINLGHVDLDRLITQRSDA